ncbi:MAG: ABC transporter substrate-binding protein [Burkholderiales bacterium]|nr:ABC transporter substrate-binding protein [Burkholderiales bacterium]
MKRNGLRMFRMAIAGLMTSAMALGYGTFGVAHAAGSSGTGVAAKTGKLNIGFVDALTGTGAVYGLPQFEAVTLAVEQVNAAGGVLVGDTRYTLKLTHYDNRSDATESVSAVRKLLDLDDVNFILGFASTPATMPVAQSFGREKGILLVGNAAGQAITTQGAKNVFRARAPNSYVGAPLGKWLYKQGAKSIAVIGDLTNAGFSDEYLLLKEAYTALGGKIVAEETFQSADRDMYTQLTKIKGQTFDALFAIGNVEQVAFVYRQANELGYKGKVYSVSAGTAAQFLKVATPEQMKNGTEIYLVAFDPNILGPKGKQFAADFEKRFKHAPDATTANSYDMFWVLMEGLKRAGTTDWRKVADAIREIGIPEQALLPYSLLNGKLFDSNGQGFAPIGSFDWKDGNWVFREFLPGDPEGFSKFLSQQVKKK